MHRTSVSRLLVIVAVILLSTVAGLPVLGQQSALSGQKPGFSEKRGLLRPSTNRFQSAVPVPVAGASADYWFVSSRHCFKSSDSRCRECPLDYLHVAPNGCLHRSDWRSFAGSLRPGVPVCIVVHGSFVNWQNVRHDSHHTYRWLRSAAPGRPLHIVFFTWPAEGYITMVPHVDVALLGRRSARHGRHLARLVTQIPADHPVSIVGHSHGARLVAAALHLLGGGQVQRCRLRCLAAVSRRIRVVFAAAALDHHWLNPGERYGRALDPIESLLNLRNRRDLPLSAYPFRRPFSRRALARVGFTRSDVARLGWQATKIAEVDVTRLVGTGHFWPNYYRRPEIACAIVPYVYFTDGGNLPPNLSRNNSNRRQANPKSEIRNSKHM